MLWSRVYNPIPTNSTKMRFWTIQLKLGGIFPGTFRLVFQDKSSVASPVPERITQQAA